MITKINRGKQVYFHKPISGKRQAELIEVIEDPRGTVHRVKFEDCPKPMNLLNWKGISLIDPGYTKSKPLLRVTTKKSYPSPLDYYGKHCVCGCGKRTGGNFAPGHDAKVKSLLRKRLKGEMVILPSTVVDFIKNNKNWLAKFGEAI